MTYHFGFGQSKIDFSSNLARESLLGTPEKKIRFYVFSGSYNFNFETLENWQHLATVQDPLYPSQSRDNPYVYYVYGSAAGNSEGDIFQQGSGPNGTLINYFMADEYDWYIQSVILVRTTVNGSGFTDSCGIMLIDNESSTISINGVSIPSQSPGQYLFSATHLNEAHRQILYTIAPEDICISLHRIYFDSPAPLQAEQSPVKQNEYIKIPLTVNTNITCNLSGYFNQAVIYLYGYPKSVGQPVCTNYYDFGNLTKATNNFLKLEASGNQIIVTEETIIDRFTPQWLESLLNTIFGQYVLEIDFIKILLNLIDFYDQIPDDTEFVRLRQIGAIDVFNETQLLAFNKGSTNCSPHYLDFYLGGHPCPNSDCSDPCDDTLCCYDPVNGESMSNNNIEVIFGEAINGVIVRIWGKPKLI